MKDYRSVKMSNQAYQAAMKLRDSDERYQSRGLVGLLDDIFLHKFTTDGKGSYDRNAKKGVDIK